MHLWAFLVPTPVHCSSDPSLFCLPANLDVSEFFLSCNARTESCTWTLRCCEGARPDRGVQEAREGTRETLDSFDESSKIAKLG